MSERDDKGGPKKAEPADDSADDREARLAQALRDNLKRRKSRTRREKDGNSPS